MTPVTFMSFRQRNNTVSITSKIQWDDVIKSIQWNPHGTTMQTARVDAHKSTLIHNVMRHKTVIVTGNWVNFDSMPLDRACSRVRNMFPVCPNSAQHPTAITQITQCHSLTFLRCPWTRVNRVSVSFTGVRLIGARATTHAPPNDRRERTKDACLDFGQFTCRDRKTGCIHGKLQRQFCGQQLSRRLVFGRTPDRQL